MTRSGVTRAGHELLDRSPSWNALPERTAGGRWSVTDTIDPLWPEYGASLRLLNALSVDGHDVEDLDGTLFERGRQVAVPRAALVHTTSAPAILESVALADSFHVASFAVDGRTDVNIEDGWKNEYEARRFRTTLSPDRGAIERHEPGVVPTTVSRIAKTVEPLPADGRGMYTVPSSGPYERGWGRLAPVVRTILELGFDVRPDLGAYTTLSGVVRPSWGTEIHGADDWTELLARFEFPPGIHFEVLSDGYAIVRDIPHPGDPLQPTFALVFAPRPSARPSLFARIFS
ncbi:hypothetical protein NYS50_13160 [Curtobacterium flaccumfaciens pv. flaccumfaciens]|uniref:hypothetical protein n=1 Tax=Curtobacterium flaccumfaciens TaxID=2035 RepID=UPI00217D288A|nr:hypothetical protein [Curtobacterium flaccumfaciens]MCS6548830.1 hypothetical protein [Curtobacterium flaccumfaciens pv. flaccumfaciens]